MAKPEPVRKMAVLVVDDDEDIREGIKELFEHFGFSVDTATNRFEAQQKLSAANFDILLSDIQMPGTEGGLEAGVVLANWVLENQPAVKVVLMSYTPREWIKDIPQGVIFFDKTKSSIPLIKELLGESSVPSQPA